MSKSRPKPSRFSVAFPVVGPAGAVHAVSIRATTDPSAQIGSALTDADARALRLDVARRVASTATHVPKDLHWRLEPKADLTEDSHMLAAAIAAAASDWKIDPAAPPTRALRGTIWASGAFDVATGRLRNQGPQAQLKVQRFLSPEVDAHLFVLPASVAVGAEHGLSGDSVLTAEDLRRRLHDDAYWRTHPKVLAVVDGADDAVRRLLGTLLGQAQDVSSTERRGMWVAFGIGALFVGLALGAVAIAVNSGRAPLDVAASGGDGGMSVTDPQAPVELLAWDDSSMRTALWFGRLRIARGSPWPASGLVSRALWSDRDGWQYDGLFILPAEGDAEVVAAYLTTARSERTRVASRELFYDATTTRADVAAERVGAVVVERPHGVYHLGTRSHAIERDVFELFQVSPDATRVSAIGEVIVVTRAGPPTAIGLTCLPSSDSGRGLVARRVRSWADQLDSWSRTGTCAAPEMEACAASVREPAAGYYRELVRAIPRALCSERDVAFP